MKPSLLPSLLLTGLTLLTQNALAIDVEKMTNLTQALTIEGFGTPDSVDTEDDTVIATYQKGKDFLRIKIETRSSAPNWDTRTYLFEGNETEFAQVSNMGMLVIDLKKSESILTLSSNRITDQQALEMIARQTGLLNASLDSVAWPDPVPQAYRIHGKVIEAGVFESDLDGYNTVCEITFMVDDVFKNAYSGMLSQYRDADTSLDYIVFPDTSMLTQPYAELEELLKIHSNGDQVTLSYYIP